MVALVFIYNHRYDANIKPLEDIYKERFSNIFHMMPFYDGSKENVIPIYEHSFYFQGYIAQASKILKTKGDFEHCIFIADDLYLNPKINEKNYQDFLEINSNKGFITHINHLATAGDLGYPQFLLHKAQYFNIPHQAGTGLEIAKELPSYDEALTMMKEKGFNEPFIRPQHVYFMPKRTDFKRSLRGTYWYRKRQQEVKRLLAAGNVKVSYPMVEGFSDFVVIPKQDLDKFARYCGLFAAARMFVEYAIPTAMLMTCKKIKTKKDINHQCVLHWDDDRDNFEKKYELSLTKLEKEFPETALYIHPVKLSKWTK